MSNGDKRQGYESDHARIVIPDGKPLVRLEMWKYPGERHTTAVTLNIHDGGGERLVGHDATFPISGRCRLTAGSPAARS